MRMTTANPKVPNKSNIKLPNDPMMFGSWRLKIGYCLDIGAWLLVLRYFIEI
jgi:hypothetical protein